LDKEERIIQIECTAFYNIALSNKGKIYSWGMNSQGNSDSILFPSYLYQFEPYLKEDEYMTQLSVGILHNLVLTNHGKVFSWGFNIFGQCGVDHSNGFLGPNLVTMSKKNQLDNNDRIIKVVANGHSLALTNKGYVYDWGTNKLGQCGIENPEALYKPNQIPFFDKKMNEKDPIVDIDICPSLSVARSEKGLYYVWGFEREWKLKPGHLNYFNILSI